MIRFLLKGLFRDRSRSLLPFVTVVLGSMLTVVGYNWIKGAVSGMVESSANFQAGHVKVMSRAYAAEADLAPNDLAYTGVRALVAGHPGEEDGGTVLGRPLECQRVGLRQVGDGSFVIGHDCTGEHYLGPRVHFPTHLGVGLGESQTYVKLGIGHAQESDQRFKHGNGIFV